MKKVLSAIGMTSLLFAGAQNASAQCDAEKYANECITNLQAGFTFLKSFDIDGQGGARDKVEHSYVFTKGAQYQIVMCNPGEGTDGLIVNLLDSGRTQVASSYWQGRHLKGLSFLPNATGIHSMQFTFDGSEHHCAGSVLGFKR